VTEDAVFRALADISRRQLLDRLRRRNGLTLVELCEGLGITRQAVTKHLAVLEDANLISSRREGREKRHFINPVPINAIAERWIARFEQPRLHTLSQLKQKLEGLDMTETAHSQYVYVTYIRTTAERLWQALINPEFTQQYWFGIHHETDWRQGSPWKLVFPDGRVADSGEILEIVPNKRIVLSWQNEFRPELKAEGFSRCTIELEEADGAMKLTIVHTIDRAGSKLIEAVSGGWPKILSNLKSLLETGELATTAR
jgi:uncharacterized protein YndB with AHSA1/START domain/DNA-binding transcriptional ArsR family regulator